METRQPTAVLPPIPAKRYFTIGEVSELCAVKPHVLRYWEQEFTQLRPMKRRGNRRYYQHHEVLLIRKIRELLYDQGFTISGARNQLMESRSAAQTSNGAHAPSGAGAKVQAQSGLTGSADQSALDAAELHSSARASASGLGLANISPADLAALHQELEAVLVLLKGGSNPPQL
jgi:DNA-binding transcriptional MerR regulator